MGERRSRNAFSGDFDISNVCFGERLVHYCDAREIFRASVDATVLIFWRACLQPI